MFQNPTLQRPPHLRPILMLWGRFSPHCGQYQLVPENICLTIQRQQLRDFGKSQQPMPGLLPSSGVFVPIQVNGTALCCLLGVLPVERLCHLYRMHSKERHFSLCNPGDPHTMMHVPVALPCFLTGALPDSELQNIRLCTLLSI